MALRLHHRSLTLLRQLAAALVILVLAGSQPANAYSVLSHEEVVDMAWKQQIVPLLQARFPGMTTDDLRQAHAYAYGGSVIQDIGYYPFGSHYFSDLLHYVRPNDFVEALIRDSTTPDEYAFALGALAHFCGDTVGHPYINQVTASENPRLEHRYGPSVTYAEDPVAHLRTEFGFDVVEVAQGHYSQENYRDFIGFQVSKPLLERAFRQTYGLEMNSIIKHEDLAISTYRHAVSGLIPKMTTIAFVSYKDQIQQAEPGIQKRKFLYRLDQTEYKKEFGTDYTHVGFRGRLLAGVLQCLPKIGPLKSLKVTVPDAQQQEMYLKSVNSSVDQFKLYLAEIYAVPLPLPPVDPKDAADARKAADKLDRDAEQVAKAAEKATDLQDKARKEAVAANVSKTAAEADAAAARVAARVQAPPPDNVAGLSPPALAPLPTAPALPELDMDTGKPTHAGEYSLADNTYAQLLDDLVQPAKPASVTIPATPRFTDQAATIVDASLARDIQDFFAHPVASTVPPRNTKEAARQATMAVQIKADLAILQGMSSDPAPAQGTH